jgi:exodeoxyribonuclease VII large subunit
VEKSNRQVISVSELNRDARRLLESEFPLLHVEGEISNLARPSSGHWYFTLKDDKAQVRCAMFRNRNQIVRFEPRNGQQIVVRGRISLYEGRGEFQMIADFLEDSGDGALRRAFEKLRDSLQREGLFNEARKKPIPAVPSHIAIITSPSGAAIRDVITVMKRRFAAVHLNIIPVQVQGEESVAQIVAALAFANSFTDDPFDLVLLTRGGGSLEDLWSFNTEPVARAIASSQLPVVSAVGHESDITIADFVADLRAPTPSAAAELITPDSAVWEDSYTYLARRLSQAMAGTLNNHSREISHLARRLRHPSRNLSDLGQRLDDLERRLVSHGARQLESYDIASLARRLQLGVSTQLNRQRARVDNLRIASPAAALSAAKVSLNHQSEKLVRTASTSQQIRQQRLAAAVSKLQTLSPLSTLERGYAIVSSETDGHVITDAESVKPGDRIRAKLMQGEILAEVTGKEL